MKEARQVTVWHLLQNGRDREVIDDSTEGLYLLVPVDALVNAVNGKHPTEISLILEAFPGIRVELCDTCDGIGVFTERLNQYDDIVDPSRDCPDCNRRGWRLSNE